MRNVCEQRAHQHDAVDTQFLRQADELGGVGTPLVGGLHAVDEDEIDGGPGDHGLADAGVRPLDAPLARRVPLDHGAGELEVVELVGIDRGDPLAAEEPAQVLQGVAGRFTGVVPALERRQHDGDAPLGLGGVLEEILHTGRLTVLEAVHHLTLAPVHRRVRRRRGRTRTADEWPVTAPVKGSP